MFWYVQFLVDMWLHNQPWFKHDLFTWINEFMNPWFKFNQDLFEISCIRHSQSKASPYLSAALACILQLYAYSLVWNKLDFLPRWLQVMVIPRRGGHYLRVLFEEYLEDIPANIFAPKNYLKSFSDVFKSHKRSVNLCNRANFRQFSDW